MKYILLILLIASPIFTQENTTLSQETIEQIYTEAIDAQFAGDLVKARELLENLKVNNITNEFIMTLLTDVYLQYMVSLVQQKDITIITNNYPEVRKNIAEIWDLYPENSQIQDNSIKIVWMMGDEELGVSMLQLALENDRNHLLANYFTGLYNFTPERFQFSIPYFQRVAEQELQQDKEQFSYQSMLYLGDIFLKNKRHNKALYYYTKAQELSDAPELTAKLALLDTYFRNYDKAALLFQNIPVLLVSPDLYDVFLATLYGKNDRAQLNFYLSQRRDTPFARSLTQFHLGRTTRAIALLQEDEFVKAELPYIYYDYLKNLYVQLGNKKDLDKTYISLSEVELTQENYSNSLDFLNQISETNTGKTNENAKIALLYANTYNSLYDYAKAKEYYEQSLSQEKSLLAYGGIISILAQEKNSQEAQKYLVEAKTLGIDSNLVELCRAVIANYQDDFMTAETIINELRTKIPLDLGLNNFYAGILIEQKRYQEADNILLTNLEFDPYNLATLNLLAYSYALQNTNLAEATRYIQRVLKEEPGNIAYIDTLFWIYIQQNNLESAESIAQEIEALLPQYEKMYGIEEIYDHLAIYYEKLGNEELAEEYAQKGSK